MIKKNIKFFYRGRKDFYKVEEVGSRKHHVSNPFPAESDKGKEWQRGFNSSYFINLKRQRAHEQTRKTRTQQV